MLKLLLYVYAHCVFVYDVFGDFGETSKPIKPTKGEVWPMPQAQIKRNNYYTFIPSQFTFTITNFKCELLDKAILRYQTILKDFHDIARRNRQSQTEDSARESTRYQGAIKQLQLNLTAPCEDYPSFDMDESYKLSISSVSFLTSDSIWGMLRGLETVSQLFYITDDYTEVRINSTEIFDFPHYVHRGLLVDTARHFLPLPTLLRALDAMAYNKMNVLHWHIVDDQSFPYQSEMYPELSEKGAYFPTMVYTKADVTAIIEYARERGIRVIPEIDTPGHTLSWGKSHPHIMTSCNIAGDRMGPLHPLRKSTYKIIQGLFHELQSLFRDDHFHVGGDEINIDCWYSNSEIRSFCTKNNIPDVVDVIIMFMSKLFRILGNNTVPIVWQEVFDLGTPLPRHVVVQVWKPRWIQEAVEVLKNNHSVIISSPWYLDHTKLTFADMYVHEPRHEISKHLGKQPLLNVIGGEACLWSEHVNEYNFHTRVWPRTAAVAEVLWSVTRGALPAGLRPRLEEHACRLQRRHVPTDPPHAYGYCVT